ncbi:class I SAM-dependent methyltransferase [Arthrobacter castelli]|uniref:class I SAM-dependent methyltransferase n=1 Tax=Arthrobacter castelli TaxID=271431 RepID=UPI0003F6BE5F|nr:class I SAM-dependent methyltransferase [Arthrobacter castelli]
MTTTSAPGARDAVPDTQTQAGVLLAHTAGFMAHRTIDIGLRSGLLRGIGTSPGATADELAETLNLDGFYVSVWCRAAFAAAVLERSGDGYVLAPHVETLLLDRTSPAYIGATYQLMRQPEILDRFEANLATGERLWWDETSPDWIASVAGTGLPFYTRLIPAGLDQIPGAADALARGCRVMDTSCGTGSGLIRLAEAYPLCRITGVDGDQHSIDRAARAVEEAGLSERVRVVRSALEELTIAEPVTVVINNISMHECRDIDVVTKNVKESLEPGGWFVISDFPFPASDEGLRSVPGRIMCGIQFFEAQIDDQLLPRQAYDRLLTAHGFEELGSFVLSPVHAVTYGRKPLH